MTRSSTDSDRLAAGSPTSTAPASSGPTSIGPTAIGPTSIGQVDVPDYQSLSGKALLALALGALSATAFIGPLFFVVPAAAVALALAALAAIGRRPDVLAGRRIALAGLGLAILFATSSYLRLWTRDRLYVQQTIATAQEWRQALAEQRHDRWLELNTARAVSPFRPQTPRGEAPPPEEESRAYMLDKLRSNPMLLSLAGEGSTPLTFVRILSSPEADQGITRLTSQFASQTPQGDPQYVAIEFARNSAYEKEGDPWRINGWGVVDADGQASKP